MTHPDHPSSSPAGPRFARIRPGERGTTCDCGKELTERERRVGKICDACYALYRPGGPLSEHPAPSSGPQARAGEERCACGACGGQHFTHRHDCPRLPRLGERGEPVPSHFPQHVNRDGTPVYAPEHAPRPTVTPEAGRGEPEEPFDLASVQDPNFTGGLDPVEYIRQLHEGERPFDRPAPALPSEPEAKLTPYRAPFDARYSDGGDEPPALPEGDEGEVIDSELADTAECSAYPNEGRCTHTRCLLRERNQLAARLTELEGGIVTLTAAVEAATQGMRDIAAQRDEARRQLSESQSQAASAGEALEPLLAAIKRTESQPVQWPRDRAGMVKPTALRTDLTLLLRRVAAGDVIFVGKDAALVPAHLLTSLRSGGTQ